MNNAVDRFASLIAPMTNREFFGEYWERDSLHLRRGDPTFYREVLQPQDVDAFLSRHDIRYPSLRMAHDGPTIPSTSYSSILKFGSYASDGLVNTAQVKQLHASGATIILQMTRSSIPRLANFANALQQVLRFNVETTVYLTPQNAQGFTTHYDTHSVMILQIAGRKRWRLYDVMCELPTLEQTFDTCKVPPGPVRKEIVLEPGDFLYVPRGMGHDAITDDDKSLHVTVGLFPPLWLDLFSRLLNETKDDLRFRRSPANHLAINGDSTALDDDLQSLLRTVRDRFNTDRLLAAHELEAGNKHTQSNEGRLIDSLSVDGICLETVVGRRREIDCATELVEGYVYLRFYGKRLKFPRAVSPAIESFFSHERVKVNDIQDNLANDSKLVLVKKLVREGLLSISTAG